MITVPTPNEYKEVLRFLDITFKRPFKRLIPSLYGDDSSMPYHYVLRGENGKINGAVCAYPGEIDLGGEYPLKILDIGMVATRKSARGQGIMVSLVNHAIEEYRKNGVELVCLTGRRKRYEHLGFYPGGRNREYEVGKMSTRNVVIREPITFIPAKTSEHKAYIDKVAESNPKRTVFPTAKTSDTIGNWFAKVYVVSVGGTPKGYMYTQFNNVCGLCLEDKGESAIELYKEVIKAYVEYKGVTVKVQALPREVEFNKALSDISERVTVEAGFKFRILDYRAVVKMLYAEAQAFYGYSKDFSVSVEIVGEDKFLFGIKDGKAFTDDFTDNASVVVTPEEATRMLLGPDRVIGAPVDPIFALAHSDLN